MVSSVIFSEKTEAGLPIGWGMTLYGIMGKKIDCGVSCLTGSNIFVSKSKTTAIFAISVTLACLGVAIAAAAVALFIMGAPLTLPLLGAACAGIGIASFSGYMGVKSNTTLSEGTDFQVAGFMN